MYVWRMDKIVTDLSLQDFEDKFKAGFPDYTEHVIVSWYLRNAKAEGLSPNFLRCGWLVTSLRISRSSKDMRLPRSTSSVQRLPCMVFYLDLSHHLIRSNMRWATWPQVISGNMNTFKDCFKIVHSGSRIANGFIAAWNMVWLRLNKLLNHMETRLNT